MPPSRIKLLFLPKDKHYWRIDWFGEVCYRSPAVRSSTPSIQVALSQWPDANLDAERIKNVSGLHHCQAHIPVGYLGKVKIGDVWRKGELAASPPYQIECFTDVSIGRVSTDIIKAGQCKELPTSKIHYLPFNVHPYHSDLTGSYCLMVTLPNEKRMIVPAIELVRFYFGSSSNLINALFRVPLTQNKLWTDAKDGYGRSKSKILLAADISGWSASDIARMAFNSHAWHAATLVGNSLSVANSCKLPTYAKTHFPFEGKTTLTVSGVWLPFGNDPCSTFLVFKILSCTHPFPFSELDYEMHGRSSNIGGFGKETSDSKHTDECPQSTPIVAKRSSKNHIEDDPSKNLGVVEAVIEEVEQFPDLKAKWVLRVTESEHIEIQKQSIPGIPILAASTGTGGMADDIRPVDLVRHSEYGKQDSDSSQLMREVKAELSASGRFDKIEMVCVEQNEKLDIYISYYDALMRYREELSDLSVSKLSNMQIAAVITGRVKAFLLVAEIDLPLRLSPFCIAVMPDSAKKAVTVTAEVIASLDAQSHPEMENEYCERMQYFVAVPDITLKSDLSKIVQQLSYHVELHCEMFQSTGMGHALPD